MKDCPSCKGKGMDELGSTGNILADGIVGILGGTKHKCFVCKGSGRVPNGFNYGFFWSITCDRCGRKSYVLSLEVTHCKFCGAYYS